MREDLHKIKVGDICDLKNGFAFKSKDYIGFSNTMNFRMSQIRPGGKVNLDHNPTYLPDNYTTVYSDYLLKDGDVVIAMTDMASDTKILGVPTLVKKDDRNLLLNQRVGKFTDLKVDIIHIPYLRYIITSPQIYAYYKKLGKGGMQINLGKNDVLNAEFTLVSLPEQRAIVTKLEELFSDLDKGIADFKKAQDQLKIYRLAVLKKAFEGELTKEWREQQTKLPTADELLRQIKEERQKHYEHQLENWKQAVKAWEEKGKEGKKPGKPSITKTASSLTPAEIKHLYDLPNHWRWLKLSEVSQEMCLGKMLDKKKNQGDFKPYLANINVRWGEFDLQFVKEMKFLDSENERYNLLKGDLVICEGGEPGRCAVWNSVGEMKIQKALHRVRFFKDYTDSNFVYHFLKFSAFSGTLSKYFTGTTIKHLTGQGLAKVPIPGLSLLEQRKIVREIESRLSVCDNVELSISESLEKANALRQSILKKAFEGTLLSEEEIAACKAAKDYEPASVLLKKIKAEKKK
jgi:type I restriction enzyme S subunit